MNYYYQDTPKRRKRKTDNKNLKIIISILLSVTLLLLLRACSSNQKEEINFLISQGESINSISERLVEQNIINSEILFKRYLSSNNLDKKIQAGSFTLNTNSSNSNIAETLTDSSQSNKMRVTIPEGYKISQIDETLTSLGLIQSGEFIDCTQNCNIDHPLLDQIPTNVNSLEGFLYPDTYFVDPATYSNQKLILDLLNNFQVKLPENWEELVSQSPASNLYEAIIMASIVEREVLSAKDKSIVAGLLWKRLANDWRIDADAALLYDQDDNIITQTDLQSDSTYNLRKVKGLTPTPISNPSIITINATLKPTDTNYWFYITTLDTGEVIYAETLDQHNSNVQRYLR